MEIIKDNNIMTIWNCLSVSKQKIMAIQFYPYRLYGARPVVLLTKLCLFGEVDSNMLVTLMFQDLLWHPSLLQRWNKPMTIESVGRRATHCATGAPEVFYRWDLSIEFRR